MKVQTKIERLGAMFLNVDAFIALPGSLETLEQILTLIFWADKSIHQKLIGFLNINDFYDYFLYFLPCSVELRFIPYSMHNIMVSPPTADQLFEKWQYPLIVRPQITSQEV